MLRLRPSKRSKRGYISDLNYDLNWDRLTRVLQPLLEAFPIGEPTRHNLGGDLRTAPAAHLYEPRELQRFFACVGVCGACGGREGRGFGCVVLFWEGGGVKHQRREIGSDERFVPWD